MLDPLDSINVNIRSGGRLNKLFLRSRWSSHIHEDEDVFTQKRRPWVRLGEKGGKRHEMPCYIDICRLAANPKAVLLGRAIVAISLARPSRSGDVLALRLQAKQKIG